MAVQLWVAWLGRPGWGLVRVKYGRLQEWV